MNITKRWLQKKEACYDGIDWFVENYKSIDGIKLVKDLIKFKKLGWANWLIVRIMKYKQYVAYAIYGVEQVIDIYEKKYPDDNRPREAIRAAKKCLKNPTRKNKNAAAAAVVYASATIDYASVAADYAAASVTAAAVVYASAVVDYASDAVAYAASAAAYAAASDAVAYAAANVAKNKMKLKILNHGIKLLEVA